LSSFERGRLQTWFPPQGGQRRSLVLTVGGAAGGATWPTGSPPGWDGKGRGLEVSDLEKDYRTPLSDPSPTPPLSDPSCSTHTRKKGEAGPNTCYPSGSSTIPSRPGRRSGWCVRGRGPRRRQWRPWQRRTRSLAGGSQLYSQRSVMKYFISLSASDTDKSWSCQSH